jgi:hypothetical protein
VRLERKNRYLAGLVSNESSMSEALDKSGVAR